MSLAQPLSHFEPFPVDDDLELEHLITEDEAPVDNIFVEKQQYLLTRSLIHSSWTDRPFLTTTNVGIFSDKERPPLVPDVLVSLDVVAPPADPMKKANRSYFMWKYGKPPEVVIEIVSNRRGGEAGTKLQEYAKLGVWYYVIFDHERRLGKKVLRLFELHGTEYLQRVDKRLTRVGLELMLWQGTYEGMKAQWLRWRDRNKQLLLTGDERVAEVEQRAQTEARARWDAEQRAQTEVQARQDAEQRAQAAETELARLKALLKRRGGTG